MSKAHATRKLHVGHFAFMRALVQGVDARSAWQRYLQSETDSTDGRRITSAIAWIRSEFAAAAKREKKPGTARLVLMDTAQIPEGPPAPSLDEFIASNGWEDWPESEQVAAYMEKYGSPGAIRARRSRVIAKQLEALQWLEDLVAQAPKPGDGVGAWFAPALADKMERSGLPTLFSLVQRINGIGARWWTGVPGIGTLKASRVVAWLRMHEGTIGVAVGGHVDAPRTKLRGVDLVHVVPAGTALVPLEKLVVPEVLSGKEGAFRAPRQKCLLSADDDYSAIAAWLEGKRDSIPTQRAYRKEGERLLLWAVLVRKKPLSSLTVEDASAFVEFLRDPPSEWCGPRHRQRWSPLWRPLEGALSASALRQAITILRGLFSFLVSSNYVFGNPFSGVKLPRAAPRPLGSNRTLPVALWDSLASTLGEESTPSAQRCSRAIRWLYATGLRLDELASARCGDLQRLEYTNAQGRGASGWLLNVEGKGGRFRQVPVPRGLVDELGRELARIGRSPEVDVLPNSDIPILASWDSEALAPFSPSGLYKAIKSQFLRCAARLESKDPAGAARLRSASPHWLRHSHGTHALNGRPGTQAVALQVVQNNLGHASIGTTSMYLQTELEDRLKAMDGFWSSAIEPARP